MAAAIDGGGFVSQLREGVMLFAEGMGFLRREKRLWPLAGVPVGFAVLAVGTAATVFWLHLTEVHVVIRGWLPLLEATAWWTWIWVGPGQALFFVLGWLGVVLAFAVALVASLLLANLASAPFLDALSQRVEIIASGHPLPASDGLGAVLGETLRSFAAELQRVAFLAGLWIVLTGAGFVVPGAHVVTGPLLVATTILFLPLDYAGFALDRRGVSFGARRRWLWSRLPTMVGFGGVAFLSCLVPGLNLVVMPSLVTAGTLLVVRSPLVASEAARPADGL